MRVVWTSRALKSYFKVADYLQEAWGDVVVRDFAGKVETVIGEIQEYPELFEASRHYKNVRKGFVTEHNSLFYRIKTRKKEIELLVFWDNRQDEKKQKY